MAPEGSQEDPRGPGSIPVFLRKADLDQNRHLEPWRSQGWLSGKDGEILPSRCVTGGGRGGHRKAQEGSGSPKQEAPDVFRRLPGGPRKVQEAQEGLRMARLSI